MFIVSYFIYRTLSNEELCIQQQKIGILQVMFYRGSKKDGWNKRNQQFVSYILYINSPFWAADSNTDQMLSKVREALRGQWHSPHTEKERDNSRDHSIIKSYSTLTPSASLQVLTQIGNWNFTSTWASLAKVTISESFTTWKRTGHLWIYVHKRWTHIINQGKMNTEPFSPKTLGYSDIAVSHTTAF